MIIPSIDIMGGQAVQLVGGKEMAVAAGDPMQLVDRFAIAGEIAVIDLDAAMGKGSNEKIIAEIIARAPCRVGGGIRSKEAAMRWLDLGAQKVILGTQAVPEVLSHLPSDRVIAALDAVHGEVVVNGWQTKTGVSIAQRMKELEGLVDEFMVTFVEREGRMQGIDLGQVKLIRDQCSSVNARLTVAGGVTTLEEIAAIDAIGVRAQIGMALYTGNVDLADAIIAPLLCRNGSKSPDSKNESLWPTVVVDESGVALGLVWSSLESVREAVASVRGVYQSRSRGLWRKGETSGAIQDLIEIKLDCDQDALLFKVRQHPPGFCHLGTKTCWGEVAGLGSIASTIASRKKSAPQGSYTSRLFADDALLNAKLQEEAKELSQAQSHHDVTWESADVIYFTLVKMAKHDVSLNDVSNELTRRSRLVTRRPGNAKE